MKYPRIIYAIFPFNKNGEAEGVYVGSTCDLNARLRNHLDIRNNSKTQKELHRLMRENGYTYGILGNIEDIYENRLEYDWIDFFAKNYSELEIHNTMICKGANWHRIYYPQGQINQFNIKSWDRVYKALKIIK